MMLWLTATAAPSVDTGASDTSAAAAAWVAALIALAALVVAVLALLAARRSAKAAEDAPRIARRQQIHDLLREMIDSVVPAIKTLESPMTIGGDIPAPPQVVKEVVAGYVRVSDRQPNEMDRIAGLGVRTYLQILDSAWLRASYAQEELEAARENVSRLRAIENPTANDRQRLAEAERKVDQKQDQRAATRLDLQANAKTAMDTLDAEIARLDKADRIQSDVK